MTYEFPDKDPAERVLVAFDFSALLDSISGTPTVTIARHSGPADATPETMLDGSPAVSGVSGTQWITGGVPGCRYSLRCEATGPNGEVYVLTGSMNVRTAAIAAS
jgi:hypothetical protein